MYGAHSWRLHSLGFSLSMNFVASMVLVASALGNGESVSCALRYRWPHDTSAFTQGLLYSKGFMFESVGQFGRSELRVVEPSTGKTARLVRLPPDRFGEGLALVGDRLLQLTWRSGVAYVYEAATFRMVDSIGIASEAWGLAYDGSRMLVMSDGTAVLHTLNSIDGSVVGALVVTDGQREVRGLSSSWVRGRPERGAS